MLPWLINKIEHSRPLRPAARGWVWPAGRATGRNSATMPASRISKRVNLCYKVKTLISGRGKTRCAAGHEEGAPDARLSRQKGLQCSMT